VGPACSIVERQCRLQVSPACAAAVPGPVHLSFSRAGWFCRLGRLALRRPVSVLRFRLQCTLWLGWPCHSPVVLMWSPYRSSEPGRWAVSRLQMYLLHWHRVQRPLGRPIT
jgi:hypothetical protein